MQKNQQKKKLTEHKRLVLFDYDSICSEGVSFVLELEAEKIGHLRYDRV